MSSELSEPLLAPKEKARSASRPGLNSGLLAGPQTTHLLRNCATKSEKARAEGAWAEHSLHASKLAARGGKCFDILHSPSLKISIPIRPGSIGGSIIYRSYSPMIIYSFHQL